jgi:O-antigen ligase
MENMKRKRRNAYRFFEVAIIVVLLSSVFLFGAVQPLVFLLEEFLIFSFFIVFLVVGLKRRKTWDETPLLFPILFFLFSILIQLIPLPFGVLKFLSPQTVALRQMLGEEGGWNMLSLVPVKTLYQLLRWTTVFVFYLFIVNVFTKETVWKLLNALFALTCFEAFYGLFLLFTGSNYLLWYNKLEYGKFGNRLHGTYRNPDDMAGYLEMLIPLHIVQVISRRFITPFKSEEKARKILGIFLVMLFVVALFLTISRAGIVAFLIGMIYFYFSGLKSKEGQTQFSFYLKIIGSLAVVYLLWIGIGPIIDRFWSLTSDMQHSRGIVWNDTMKLVGDFPIFGTGFGTFRYIFPRYKTLLSQGIWDYPHNDYLQVLAEGGVVSMLAFLWLLLNALRMLTSKKHPLARGATAGFIAILVHSFFDFNLQIPANAYIFATLLAIGWISVRENHDRRPLPPAARY